MVFLQAAAVEGVQSSGLCSAAAATFVQRWWRSCSGSDVFVQWWRLCSGNDVLQQWKEEHSKRWRSCSNNGGVFCLWRWLVIREEGRWDSEGDATAMLRLRRDERLDLRKAEKWEMWKKFRAFTFFVLSDVSLVTCVWKGVRDSEWNGARGWGLGLGTRMGHVGVWQLGCFDFYFFYVT